MMKIRKKENKRKPQERIKYNRKEGTRQSKMDSKIHPRI
jgi:hypothetical protein